MSDFTRIKFASFYSALIFIYSLFFLSGFANASDYFRYMEGFSWFSNSGSHFTVGLDGVSLFFLLLTTFLTPLCILISVESTTYRLSSLITAFFAVEFFLVLAFSSLNLFLFYISFESILIPMYFIIGVWGSRERKVLAAYYLFFYTLVGSLLLLVGIAYIQLLCGTTEFSALRWINFSYQDQVVL